MKENDLERQEKKNKRLQMLIDIKCCENSSISLEIKKGSSKSLLLKILIVGNICCKFI